MKLNGLEFALVNITLRAASQRRIETPRLIGPRGSLARKPVLEIGCGRGVGREIARVLKPGSMFYFEDLLKDLILVWPVPVFFDHPQATQFYGREFRLELESPGLRVQN